MLIAADIFRRMLTLPLRFFAAMRYAMIFITPPLMFRDYAILRFRFDYAITPLYFIISIFLSRHAASLFYYAARCCHIIIAVHIFIMPLFMILPYADYAAAAAIAFYG